MTIEFQLEGKPRQRTSLTASLQMCGGGVDLVLTDADGRRQNILILREDGAIRLRALSHVISKDWGIDTDNGTICIVQ